MKSSFELLWYWVRKKMNLDEQILKRVDKQMLNQLVNENVIRFQPKTKFKKGSFYCPFFLSALKIFNELLRRLEIVFSFFWTQV